MHAGSPGKTLHAEREAKAAGRNSGWPAGGPAEVWLGLAGLGGRRGEAVHALHWQTVPRKKVNSGELLAALWSSKCRKKNMGTKTGARRI